MDKITFVILKWKQKRSLITSMRQESAMAGASKRDLGAMDAYIKTFDEFINDLYKLKE